MTEGFFDILARSLFGIPFERFGNEFLRINSNSKHQCEHNPAKENAESKLDNAWTNFEILQSHGHRQDDHKPFHSGAQQTRILEIQVHGPYQDTSRKKASDDTAD